MSTVLFIKIIAFFCIFFLFFYCSSRLCRLLKKEDKRYQTKKKIKKKIAQIILCLIFFILIMLWGDNEITPNNEQFIARKELKIYKEDFFTKELSRALAKEYITLEFFSIKENIWDHFIMNEIGYFNYIAWKEETNSFDELRKKYLENSKNSSVVPFADLDEICGHIKYFYETSFIPYTTRTLDEVTAEIDEETDASPELYAEELYLRSLKCSKNSAEAIYQLGRSADDAFKQSVKWNKAENKQLIFYASVTLVCYQLASEQYKINSDLPVTKERLALINYRMAEIYIYLDRHCFFTGEYSYYKQHFKLSAEACLVRAKIEYDPMNIGLDMNEKYPYYDDYYTELLSDFIKQYNACENGIIDEFYEHANKYINSPFAKKNNVKNSQNLILKMDNFLGSNQ